MNDFKIYTVDEDTGRIALTPPSPPQTVSGLEKLIQVVLIALLTTPGRNALYPTYGSGIRELIGSNIDPNDTTEILAELSERVEKIKAEILESQVDLENEDPSERLRELIVLSVETGVNFDEVMLRFKIISEAGDEFNLAI